MGETVENAPRSPEMKNFDDALRRVLRVSKDDLKRLLGSEEAKAAVKQKRVQKRVQKRKINATVVKQKGS
jgi:hypothetical protein